MNISQLDFTLRIASFCLGMLSFSLARTNIFILNKKEAKLAGTILNYIRLKLA